MNQPLPVAKKAPRLEPKPNHSKLFVLASLNNDEEVRLSPPRLTTQTDSPLLSITQYTTMVSTRSNRTSSPTPSDSSDVYWQEADHDNASPAPSQTADAFGWDSDSSEAPFSSANATPTPTAVRPSTPASVVEISREEFPPLVASTPATAIKPRTKTSKGKGKKKASAGLYTYPDPSLPTNA